MERVIKAQLQIHMDQHKILMPEQFGFRPKHSTQHQLLRVVEFLSEKLNSKTPVAAILLDIAKAFDKIWHEALIYKLIQCKFPARLIHLIHSYLCNRQLRVRLNNALSDLYNILSGVLQGSALGPTLFNIFFNDIPRTIYTYLALYADDTAIYASAHHIHTLYRILQNHIDSFTDWCSRWRVKINESKTAAIYFSKTYQTPQRIIVNTTTIPWSDHANYLGITLDKRLTWQKHIQNIRIKVAIAAGSLKPLMAGRTLSIHNKLILYNTCILPIMTYGCPIWGFVCDTSMNNLCRLHNKNLRIVRGASRYLRNTTILRDLQTTNFKQRVKHLAQEFYISYYNLPNEIIAETEDYEVSSTNNRKRPRYSTILGEDIVH